MQKSAFKFLEGEQDDIDELNSMRQVKELFAQMRNIYRKLEYEAKNVNSKAEILGSAGGQVT